MHLRENKFCTENRAVKIYLDKQYLVYIPTALKLSQYNSIKIDNDPFFLEMRPSQNPL